MKPIAIFVLSVLSLTSFNSCLKQEYFKSEKTIKKELQGTWILNPIPRYDTIHISPIKDSTIVHIETWTFDDSKVTITNFGQTGVSTYSVNTSISKAEFDLDAITPAFTYPARSRNNGTWQIVKLDNDILSIASDKNGATGLTQLEFHK